MSKVLVFYATLLYGEYEASTFRELPRQELPDGCYIRYPHAPWWSDYLWYRKDLIPVPLKDVPKEIKALCLIMGLPLS